MTNAPSLRRTLPEALCILLLLASRYSHPAAAAPASSIKADFDGDGRRDEILIRFTGGAHCCYLVGVRLSRTQRVEKLPFHLDGGYVGGLQEGDRFRVADYDGDGADDLCMEIETYNGEPIPLPVAWSRAYGLKSHWIVVSYRGAKVRARDRPRPSCGGPD